MRLGSHIHRDHVFLRPLAVDHLQGLAAEGTAQNGRAPGFQVGFVKIELIRIDCPLHDGFAQTIGAGNKDYVVETGFGIQGKHYAGGADVRAHHALNAGGKGDLIMIKTLMYPVGDGTVVIERSEDTPDGEEYLIDAGNIEIGLLLSRKGCIRQILCGSG